jgi:hypothetical protein
MSALETPAVSAVAVFMLTKKERKRKLRTWTGISEFVNEWLKRNQEANIGVGMLMNW